MRITKRYTIQFNCDIAKQPLIYHLIKDYGIQVNILRAEIMPDAEGYTLLDMIAEEHDLNAAFAYLKSQGAKLIPAKYQIHIDEDKCVQCGACTAVCFSQALTISQPQWQLQFDADRCINCGLCLSACPISAIERGHAEAD